MSEIKLAFSDKYIYKLPEGHRFPIEKYELVKDQLLHEGVVTKMQLIDPGLVTDEQILRVHSSEYLEKLITLNLDKSEKRKIGLPVTELSFKRARNSVAGTIFSAYQSLQTGLGINLAGGTHHAYADHGEGFCVLNDIAVATMELLENKKANKVMVIDLDVHQGNGTAKIFENENRVFTFSMHGKNNYPLSKEKSDLDIALPRGTDDVTYIKKLTELFPGLIDEFRPDVIFYQSGVDIMATDKLGKLGLTKEGVKKRDEFIVTQTKKNEIPLVVTMGGGYSERLSELVEAHCNTIKTALSAYE